MPPRKRKVTATRTRTRKVTVKETETVAVEETHDDYPTLTFAAGWDHMPRLDGPQLRRQRAEQVHATVQFLYIRAADSNTAETVRCAANVLRAGPAASLAERVHGRYT